MINPAVKQANDSPASVQRANIETKMEREGQEKMR